MKSKFTKQIENKIKKEVVKVFSLREFNKKQLIKKMLKRTKPF